MFLAERSFATHLPRDVDFTTCHSARYRHGGRPEDGHFSSQCWTSWPATITGPATTAKWQSCLGRSFHGRFVHQQSSKSVLSQSGDATELGRWTRSCHFPTWSAQFLLQRRIQQRYIHNNIQIPCISLSLWCSRSRIQGSGCFDGSKLLRNRPTHSSRRIVGNQSRFVASHFQNGFLLHGHFSHFESGGLSHPL